MTDIKRAHRRGAPRIPFEEIPPEQGLALWTDRFGADPNDFKDYRFFKRTRKLVWIARKDMDPLTGLDLEAIGMSFVRVGMPHPKPTTTAAVTFGHLATKNTLNLEGDALARFFLRERQPLPDPGEGVEPGYVLVTTEGRTIGVGLWIGEHLTSLVPKSWTIRPA